MKVQLKSLKAFKLETNFVKKISNVVFEVVSLLLVCADDIMSTQ